MYLQDDDLIKFSRTFHVPGSLGATNDDKVLKNLDHFEGKEVVVTEKLDGENTTGNRIKVHARSLDSKHHWTRDRVKQLFTNIQWKLSLPQFQDIHRICGENMQGLHSIYYSELETYFYCFAIWDRQNTCFSWDDMVLLCDELEVKPVPLLKRGIYTNGFLDDVYTGVSKLGGVQEGYVMRLANAFHYDDYSTSVAKFVRENHVTTDQHWMKTCNVENKIKE